jgi:hypothetical protein
MLRFLTMTLAALAIATLPLAAVAENQAAPSATPEPVVLVAVTDALPAAPVRSRESKPQSETAKHARGAHGSSQSSASFRFSNPHAFPLQTLPVNFPTLPNFGF